MTNEITLRYVGQLQITLMMIRYPPFYDDNPIGIYQKILAGKLDIPRHVDSRAKDIIKRLLTIDRTNRLGKVQCSDYGKSFE